LPKNDFGTGKGVSLKKHKWQYHKNPEAGSTDHQARGDFRNQADFKNQAVEDFKDQAVEDLTGTGLFHAKKPNIVSIIS
jgi:hypothetical protein